MPWDFIDGLYAIKGGAAPPVCEPVTVAGLRVSTVDTPDLGFETAITDAAGTYPVERHATEEAAAVGHRLWVAAAPGLTQVTRIGTGDGAVPDERVTLRPAAG